MLQLIRPQRLRALWLLGAVLALGACSTANGPDPWRDTNEKVFRFNNRLDTGLLEPVAKGYDDVVPDWLQGMVGSAFDTIKVPRTFLNDLLQGKPVRAAQDLARLAANLTLGLVGTFDVASELGLPRHEEDFGQTLAVWKVPAGPYTVLPVVGPPFNGANTPRDIVAWPVDLATDPTTWVNAFGIGLVRTVDARARFLEELGQLREDSIDFYVGVRDLYTQQRESEIRDGAPAPSVNDDDFYDIEDLDDESGAEPDAEGP